jgi:hypothetical protein
MTDDFGFYVIPKSKGGLKARRFLKMMILALVPGRSEAPPGLES